ncbi:kinesin-like protein KIN-14B [Tanacetum coccineum]|uniref:Kinesin-like protein KIN-14B n=1 Tax=Tanacetum coccineum TaxID=301880 RepID=A0ABQ5BAF2_9ASTR
MRFFVGSSLSPAFDNIIIGDVSTGAPSPGSFPPDMLPNVGIVAVPDPRLQVLSNLSKSQKSVPASIEFVDIAGLVKGANDVMNIDGLLSDEETPISSDSAGSSVSDIGSADNCFWFDLLSAYNGRGDRADPSTWPETEVAMREAGNPGMTDEEIPEPPRDPLLLTRTMRKSIIWHQIPTVMELEPLYQLSAEAYHTGRESRVVTTLTLLKPHLFRYQGHVSAYFKDEGIEDYDTKDYDNYVEAQDDILGDVLASLTSKKEDVWKFCAYESSCGFTRWKLKKALLIVNICPDVSNLSETLSTLNFSARAGNTILSLGNRNTIKNWKDVANDARKEFYEKEKESLDLKQEFAENTMLVEKHKIEHDQNNDLRTQVAPLLQQSSENTSKICLDSTKSTESAAVTKKIEELQKCDALIERLHEEYIRASISKISASLDISKVDSEGHKTQAIYRKLYKKCLRSVADKCRMRCPKCRQLIILANKKTIQPAGKDQSVMIATFKTKKVKGCESAPQVCKIASLQEYVSQDFDATHGRVHIPDEIDTPALSGVAPGVKYGVSVLIRGGGKLWEKPQGNVRYGRKAE